MEYSFQTDFLRFSTIMRVSFKDSVISAFQPEQLLKFPREIDIFLEPDDLYGLII